MPQREIGRVRFSGCILQRPEERLREFEGAERYYMGVRITMSAVWAATCWLFCGANWWQHGLEPLTIGLGVGGALPIWTFIATKFSAKVFGQQVDIDTSDLNSAFKKTSEEARKAVAQAKVVADSLAVTGRLTATLQPATLKAIGTVGPPQPPVVQDWQTDPNLVLVSIRIAIERRVRIIAELLGLDARKPLGVLISSISQREVFPGGFSEGLRRLVDYGNRAAHGYDINVDPQTALKDADALYKTLDEIIEGLEKQ